MQPQCAFVEYRSAKQNSDLDASRSSMHLQLLIARVSTTEVTGEVRSCTFFEITRFIHSLSSRFVICFGSRRLPNTLRAVRLWMVSREAGSYLAGVWLSIQLVYSEPGPMNSSWVPIVRAFLSRDCAVSRGMKSSRPSVVTSRVNRPVLRGGAGT